MLFDRDFLKHHRAGVMGGVMGGVRSGVRGGVANTTWLVLGEKRTP